MCARAIAKIMLGISNFIFVLFGGAVMGLGLFIKFNKTSTLNILTRIPVAGETIDDVIDKSSYYEQSALVLIVAGALILCISFCGCCGVWFEQKILLVLYAVLLGCVLMIQIAGAIIFFVFRERVDVYVEGFLNDTVAEKYQGVDYSDDGAYVESTDLITAAWDFAQTYFECCGSTSWNNYPDLATVWDANYTVSGVSVNAVVPPTCCLQTTASSFPDSVEFVNIEECMVNGNSTFINSDGCYETIIDHIYYYGKIVGGVAIAVTLIEILGIILACVLIRGLNKGVDAV